jgi:hypothetical protein
MSNPKWPYYYLWVWVWLPLIVFILDNLLLTCQYYFKTFITFPISPLVEVTPRLWCVGIRVVGKLLIHWLFYLNFDYNVSQIFDKKRNKFCFYRIFLLDMHTSNAIKQNKFLNAFFKFTLPLGICSFRPCWQPLPRWVWQLNQDKSERSSLNPPICWL